MSITDIINKYEQKIQGRPINKNMGIGRNIFKK